MISSTIVAKGQHLCFFTNISQKKICSNLLHLLANSLHRFRR